MPLKALLPIVPSILHDRLRSHMYYAKNSENIVISAQTHRQREKNAEDCWERLYTFLKDAGSSIPGKTSKQQKDKVVSL